MTRVMEIPWTTPVYEALVAAGVTITLAIAAGLMASTRALVARPIEVLRTE
jgi:ABC-type lipoprotein release transport system permease subunit